MTEQQTTDRRDLKIQALINKVTKTENENADYQVELHIATKKIDELVAENQELKAKLPEELDVQEEVFLPEPN